MSTFRNVSGLGLCALAMFCIDITGAGISIVPDAAAIVGRPATPVSYAGVARRSAVPVAAYHPVARTTAVVATTAAVTTAAVAASTPPPPTTLVVGSAVATLPEGCVPATIGGVAYQKCGNVYYRAAYQGNNLVYIVSAP
jgi:hypothetical protein